MIKDMEVSLGGVTGLAVPAVVGALVASGWYTDPITGQKYYYDADVGQWYIYTAAGLLYPLSLPTNTVSAPWTKLNVASLGTIKFNLSYKYRGPGGKGFTLYAAVGNNAGGGGEWAGFAASKGIYPTESLTTWKLVTDSITVPMGQAGYPTHSGETGAIYFKIEAQWLSPAYLNAIYVVTPTGEFSELAITSIAKV